MVVVFSADILINILISFYLSSALSLSQFLHSWYVKNDPIYDGKMGIGLSFFHHNYVKYTFGYLMSGLLFILVFIVVFSTLNVMPPLKSLTFEQFLWKYGIWLFLKILAIYIISDAMGPSASKLIQNIVAIFGGFMILSACTIDMSLERILDNWQNTWPIYAAPIGWGIYWVTAFQRDRMKREKEKRNRDSSNNTINIQESEHTDIEELTVYRVPVIYYFVVVFWNILLGFGFSLSNYFLAHYY